MSYNKENGVFVRGHMHNPSKTTGDYVVGSVVNSGALYVSHSYRQSYARLSEPQRFKIVSSVQNSYSLSFKKGSMFRSTNSILKRFCQ